MNAHAMSPVVVADTGPVNYLILVGVVDILSMLFGSVILPEAVHAELLSDDAPAPVKQWAEALPAWVSVRVAPIELLPEGLHRGEAEAIAIARSQPTHFVLIDEREGRAVAASLNLPLTGTLGVLRYAAARNLVVLSEIEPRLRATSFRAAPTLWRSVFGEAVQ